MPPQVNTVVVPAATVPVAKTFTLNTPDARCLVVTVVLETWTSGTVTVTLNGISAAGDATLLLASSALGAAATTTLTVCPVGVLAASANVVANKPIPPTVEVAVTVSSPVGIAYHVSLATTP